MASSFFSFFWSFFVVGVVVCLCVKKDGKEYVRILICVSERERERMEAIRMRGREIDRERE